MPEDRLSTQDLLIEQQVRSRICIMVLKSHLHYSPNIALNFNTIITLEVEYNNKLTVFYLKVHMIEVITKQGAVQ